MSPSPSSLSLKRTQILAQWEEALWSSNREHRGLAGFGWRCLQILWVSIAGLRDHHAALRASALTYTTMLSFVPMVAVAFSVLKGLGFQESLQQKLIERFAAGPDDAVRDAVDQLKQFIDRSSGASLGTIGGAGLILIALSLFTTIEHALNVVWGLERGRSFFRRAADYLSLLVFGPVLLAVGTYVTTVLQTPPQLGIAGPLQGWIESLVLQPFLRAVPYLVIWPIFYFVYYFVPNTRVSKRSAAIAGLIAGILWQLAQSIYIQYSVRFASKSYNAIYGAFAWMLLLLIWVHISWLVLLLGAEICAAHQNLKHQRRRRRTWKGWPADRETLALRLGVLLARPMLAPAGEAFEPRTLENLADELHLPPGPVEEILGLYESEGLVKREAEGGAYVFVRSPDAVHAGDILRLVRTGSLAGTAEGARGGLSEAGEGLAAALSGKNLKELAGLSLREVRTFSI